MGAGGSVEEGGEIEEEDPSRSVEKEDPGRSVKREDPDRSV